MDIKLKKWKSIVSAAAFFLGVSLLLGSLAQAVGIIGRHGYYVKNPEELLSGDYENTLKFREFISNRLDDFLTIAVNGPLVYYYDGAYTDFMETYSVEVEAKAEAAAEENQTWMEQGLGTGWQEYAYQSVLEDYGYQYGYPYMDEMSEEDRCKYEEINRKNAERFHKSVEMDKNILYNISTDGKLLYTNAGGTGLPEKLESDAAEDWLAAAPEGYNFILYFDGSKVSILKDGAFIDVYGDGIYKEDSEWYVPGYRNFPVADSYTGVRICMAVAAEPVMYTYADGKRGYMQYSNDLYWMHFHTKEVLKGLAGIRQALGSGAVCLLIYLLLRKHKKQADLLLARGTGKLWIELKVFLLAAVCVMTGVIGLAQDSGLTYELSMVFSDLSYYGGLWEFLSYAVRLLLREVNPAAIVILFWAFWLFVNDLRKNKREWKHGFCYKIYYALCVKELEGSISRKTVRRGGLVFVISATALTVLAVLAACAWIEGNGSLIGMFLIALAFLLAFAVQLAYQIRLKATAQDMELMADRVSQIRSGNYRNNGEQPKDEDFTPIFAGLEDIRNGMVQAVDEQMKSERMKVELIANVSHDIKTPLTSIISYVELLKQEQELPDYVKDYIHILDDKSNRLKNMIQDVFVVSKAASGELPVNMEILDFAKLLRQTLADMDEQIGNSRLTFKAEIPQEPIMIKADGQRLYRVFQNLLLNAMKYSLAGSRVYINLKQDASMASASVKNTSRNELNEVTDFTERFVRGDESRTDGGSGLGLSIARSFTEACGGSFKLETIADLFVVTVSFRLVGQTETEEARRELARQEAAEAQGESGQQESVQEGS